MHTNLQQAYDDLLPVDAPPLVRRSSRSAPLPTPTYDEEPFSFRDVHEELRSWLPEARDFDQNVATGARLNSNFKVSVIYRADCDLVRLSLTHDGASGHNFGRFTDRAQQALAAFSTTFELPDDWEFSGGYVPSYVLKVPAETLLNTLRE